MNGRIAVARAPALAWPQQRGLADTSPSSIAMSSEPAKTRSQRTSVPGLRASLRGTPALRPEALRSARLGELLTRHGQAVQT
jgi:hypothetical protein